MHHYLDAHSRNNKFTEFVIYFVRPNMNGASEKQEWIQECFTRGAVT